MPVPWKVVGLFVALAALVLVPLHVVLVTVAPEWHFSVMLSVICLMVIAAALLEVHWRYPNWFDSKALG